MPEVASLDPTPHDPAHRRLSPTDISQYIRLEQCQRYLWLRLHERAGGDVWREAGVARQAIPPLLTRAGSLFEQQIEAQIKAHYAHLHFAPAAGQGKRRGTDNAAFLQAAHDLAPGAVLMVFQARLAA